MTVQREPRAQRRAPGQMQRQMQHSPQRQMQRRPQRAQQPAAESRLSAAVRRIEAALDARPLIDYTMIRSIVLFLAGLGVVMAMSSSMATSFAASASVWAQAAHQAIMVVFGLVLFWVALQTPPERLRRASNWLMIISICLLVAVLTSLGTGREEVGSQSWLAIGPLRLQPSEVARVAIAMWGAQVLEHKDPKRIGAIDNGFVGFGAVATLCVLLIGMQGDMGMALSFAVVVAFILLFAGVSLKAVGVLAAGGFVALLIAFFSGGFRSNRFHVYFDALHGHFDDTKGAAFQSHQGFLSLADGNVFGVGLGQSRAKWFYLPEARNDFIFAVIGEELGLWGGALVIALFALLAFFGLRTARRAQSQYQALMAASLTAAVVSQAFVNIGYVVGLLPVTGIQLPMLSAGGSSAVITLGAMGVLANIARHEPDAISSMQNYGRPVFDRAFFIAEPRALEQGRSARQVQQGEPERRQQPRRERFGTLVTARAAAPQRYHGQPRTPRH